jgi:uncharacterized protein (DUF58 family)
MQTSEILKKVRRIEFKTGRLVSETFAGQYLSVFKGQGIEFSEARKYVAGDDARSIDWNVSARAGDIFVKRFAQERELSVIIACDVSGSQFFGGSGKFKSEAAAELGAIFAFSAIKNNDKIGLFLFSDKIELYIPPKKGKRHALRLIRELLAFKPSSSATDISSALDGINGMIKRRVILLLISDFMADGYERAFRLSSKKFDAIPVIMQDPIESALPPLALYADIRDIESGRQISVNLRSSAAALAREHNKNIRKAISLFKSAGTDYIRIDVSKNTVDPVIKFFKRRAKRIR